MDIDDVAALDRLCRMVYASARAGAVNCTDAFDLAAAALQVRPADRNATELASLSLDGATASRPRMAELALAVLDAVHFGPGFAEEPGWLAQLGEAMRLVNRDVAATGLPGTCRLRVHDDVPGFSGTAYAESWDGHRGSGQGVFPTSGADPVAALVAVADDTQDAVMHTIWAAWPVCPVHRRGVHAREHDSTAVWWCTGADGHAAAAIGAWPAE